MKKVSQRAINGGGRESQVVLNPNSGVGITYGNSGNGSGWFGPGDPMRPQAPPEVAGRAFDFPQGTNILTTTRPYESIGYEALRQFADGYDLLRLIIETRKDAMERLRWVIQLRDSKEKLTPQKRTRMQNLTKFFMKPDGEHDWNTWLRMVLEDLFVIDAVALHRRRTLGGSLISLDQIDGATIRRVLDDWGRTPEGSNDTAYQQILKGMPAVNYTKNDLIYRPRNVRVHKIYGFSPVQQIMMTINIALRRQVYQLNFFTEGNMPAALIGVPAEWTPDQIRTFQQWFDNITAGNLAEKRKARFVPNAVGKTYIPTQETELFGAAEEWLARICCFAFNISPTPFIKMIGRSSQPGSGEENSASGIDSIKTYVKSFVDDILADDLISDDFELVWRNDDVIDPVKRQEITTGYVKMGLITVNEGRADGGREPYDDPIFDKPMFLTSNGLAPLGTAVPGSELDPGNGTLDPGANGDPISNNALAEQPDKTKDIPKLDKMQAFIDAGDQEGLAGYLRKFQPEELTA